MYNDIIQAIATVGFPIVACAAVSYAYYKATIKFSDSIAAINESHRNEQKELSEAINNNTVVMERILERLQIGDEDE